VDSREVRNKLNDLIDLELSEDERQEILAYLESDAPEAAECSAIYQDLLTVKNLVRSKTERPTVPARLEQVVRAQFPDTRRRWQILAGGAPSWTAAAAAAAAVAIAATVAAVLYLNHAPRLAHADMIARCSAMFRVVAGAKPERPPPGCCQIRAAKMTRLLTGCKEVRLPKVPGARLCTTSECTVQDAKGNEFKGVRLDYYPIREENDGIDGECPDPICIFAFPASVCGDEASTCGLCDCAGVPGLTVYCFHDRDVVFSVVASVDEQRFLDAHEPTVR